MNRRLPSLNALRAFEASARQGSFTAAAQELFVTQGAVSRQVKALEEELGVLLFRRLHRGLELTAEGRTLLAAVSGAFDGIAAAAARLRNQQQDLKIKVPPTFGIRWFIPRLARFQLEQPEVQVRVTTVWRHSIDFAREDFDAGIDFGQGRWSGLCADLLQTEHLVPVCAPALLKGRRPLRTPADLARHTLLHPTTDHSDWRKWLESMGVQDVDPSQGQDFDTLETAMAAAAAGYGVAIGAYELIQEDLRAKRLVMPFGEKLVSYGSYYLIYPEDRLSRPRFVLFRDWLLAEAAADRLRPAQSLAK
ncbi:MAG TPA: transcriptional regulator GcvA [Candidatus Competibacteraceae bacterium]|nr:transcriptional regulator GcvA [Candidatus Competibacteraceae bacterium]